MGEDRFAASHLLILLSMWASIAGCASPSQGNPDPSPVPSTSTSVEPASTLEGRWETDTIPAAEIRAVVLTAGFAPEDAEKVTAGIRTFRFELRFEDGRYELSSFQDGEAVGVVEGGGYRLTEEDRLLLDTGDIGDTYLFGLDLQGDRFTLELLRSTESGTAEDKYTHSYFTTAYFTGHPFTRTS